MVGAQINDFFFFLQRLILDYFVCNFASINVLMCIWFSFVESMNTFLFGSILFYIKFSYYYQLWYIWINFKTSFIEKKNPKTDTKIVTFFMMLEFWIFEVPQTQSNYFLLIIIQFWEPAEIKWCSSLAKRSVSIEKL